MSARARKATTDARQALLNVDGQMMDLFGALADLTCERDLPTFGAALAEVMRISRTIQRNVSDVIEELQ